MYNLGVPNANPCTNFDVKSGLSDMHVNVYSHVTSRAADKVHFFWGGGS